MSIDETVNSETKIMIYRGKIYANREYLQEQKDKLNEMLGSKGKYLQRPSDEDIRWGIRESVLYRN
jgi:hypothetical protein